MGRHTISVSIAIKRDNSTNNILAQQTMRTTKLGASDLEPLLSALYEAPLNPQGWQHFLNLLTETLGATSGSFVAVDIGRPESNLSVTDNVHPDFVRLYNTHYYSQDPWALTARRRGWVRPGFTAPSQAIVPLNELKRTEFGNVAALPHGIVHGASGIIAANSDRISAISVYRDQAGTPFDTNEVRILRRLVPHIDRALRIHGHCSAIQHQATSFEQAINAFTTAVAFVTRHAKVLWLNEAAQGLIDATDGLSMSRGRLTTARRDETERFSALLRQTCESAISERSPLALSVSRPSLKPPILLLVVPLSGATEQLLRSPEGVHKAEAAIFIEDPSQAVHLPAKQLQALFHFTPAEARLAVAIAEGHSLKSIADRFRLSINTVRSQLRALLAKTGTRRQSQLVRLLVRSYPRFGR